MHQVDFSLHGCIDIYGQQNLKFRRVTNFEIPFQHSFHHQIIIISEHKNEKNISTTLQVSLKYLDILTEVTAFEVLMA